MAGATSDYVDQANQYIDDVLNGNILACKWVKLACRRQKKDLKRKYWLYHFNRDKANRICKYIGLLPHIKGEWSGTSIKLEPWQCFVLTTVFGWQTENGRRRFRTVYIEVPRKNAKSTITSGVGLFLLTADGEGGAEIYSAATTREQAKIVWQDAKDMVVITPGLRKRFGVKTKAHSIYVENTASHFHALSSEGNSLDGLNVHGGLIDELHAHKTRDVFDVIETGTGSRAQSLLWLITTAGSNRAGICYEQRSYVTKILQNVAEDETYFGIIYTIDDNDDWTDPANWVKANPNYGISIYPDDLERLARKAMEMPSATNNFLTKRLNVWVNADTAWMDMRKWDLCADLDLSIEDFKGEPCIVGDDLASKVDMAAQVVVFKREIDNKDHYYAFGKYYLPEARLNDGNSQYAGWVIEERLVTTPGDIIDYGRIESDLDALASQHEINEVAYDPFQATQFATRMAAEGFTMVESRATVKNFSEPMKELEALVLDGRFHFDGDPVLTWMVSNVVCHIDAKDNIYPNKERPENKIDGVVALIMALSRMIVPSEDNSTLFVEL